MIVIGDGNIKSQLVLLRPWASAYHGSDLATVSSI